MRWILEAARSLGGISLPVLATLVFSVPSLGQEPVAKPKRPDHAIADKARDAGEFGEVLLRRKLDFPHARGISLGDLRERLASSLGIQVVLDAAALRRLEIDETEKVRLDLKDVSLRTALKLLLDQVEMTYKVVPEDRLLVLTDPEGADDPITWIVDELSALHRDVHRLQDDVEDILFMLDDGAAEPPKDAKGLRPTSGRFKQPRGREASRNVAGRIRGARRPRSPRG